MHENLGTASNKITLEISFAAGPFETSFFGDLVYKFKRIVSRADFLISSEILCYGTNVLDMI